MVNCKEWASISRISESLPWVKRCNVPRDLAISLVEKKINEERQVGGGGKMGSCAWIPANKATGHRV